MRRHALSTFAVAAAATLALTQPAVAQVATARGPAAPSGDRSAPAGAARAVVPDLRESAKRPTDTHDPRGDSYTTDTVKRKCSAHVCVHWVTTTDDATPSGWQDTTLSQMEKIWDYEVGKLKFRAPMKDGTRGGNKKFDVYLKNLAPKGYAGYCAKEKSIGGGYTASSYCVLDNDFLPSEFEGRSPWANLRVTAAHEFFHAIQMAYDTDEDAWLVESTATWMEERYADDVNDNRKYLPVSQLAHPEEPLDISLTGDTPQFGNWIWWEYLSSRVGNGIVRSVWTKAGEYDGGGGHMYSTQALVSALKNEGTFKKRFGSYTASAVAPASAWSEGAEWGLAAPPDATHMLSGGASTGSHTVTVDHLAASNIKLIPQTGVTGKIKIDVNGPSSSSAPVAVVTVIRKSGNVTRTSMTLDGNGVGSGSYAFDAATVASVTVTLTNASTRFACWNRSGADPAYSCQGTPKDDGRSFAYSAVNQAGS
ncbi:MAG: MXAN_6640 family putative metalloprotease [Nocardioidaceae bacterium]